MTKEFDYEVRTFDTSSLSGSFQNMGAALSNPVVIMSISNPSDVGVIISKDGTTTNWQIPSLGTLTLDSRDIQEARGGPTRYLLNKGTQLEIKQVTGSGTGTVVVNLTELVL